MVKVAAKNMKGIFEKCSNMLILILSFYLMLCIQLSKNLITSVLTKIEYQVPGI